MVLLLGLPLYMQWGLASYQFASRVNYRQKTIGCDYALEYGVDRIEIHADEILEGERIVLVSN